MKSGDSSHSGLEGPGPKQWRTKGDAPDPRGGREAWIQCLVL